MQLHIARVCVLTIDDFPYDLVEITVNILLSI